MKKRISILLAVIATVFVINQAQADTWGPYSGVITTATVYNITANAAVSGGEISLLPGDPAVTQKGICWSISAYPTTSLTTKTTQGGGSDEFESNMTGLQMGTLYFVRAYITNTNGTYYGNQLTFTTVPTLPEWGLILLGGAVLALGGIFVWKRII